MLRSNDKILSTVEGSFNKSTSVNITKFPKEICGRANASGMGVGVVLMQD